MPKGKAGTATLLSLLRKSGMDSVSIVGMVKNAGKTVTFNHLVSEAAAQSMVLGLTSVGRDGEERDEVFHTPKPRIFAPRGTILATARGTLSRSEMEIAILRNTGFPTALGEVIIGQTKAAGYVELAGPTLLRQHRIIREELQACGADVVIVDGALDRVSPATPALADGIILATGAALGPSIDNVLKKTKDRLDRFTLPTVAENQRTICRQVLADSKVALIDGAGNVTVIPAAGSLVAGKIIGENLDNRTKMIVLGGAVGDGVLTGLLDSGKNLTDLCLVIKNGTCLFCQSHLWQTFREAGGLIKVVEPIHLVAITLNPVSPQGTNFSQRDFFAAAVQLLAPYPVMDVVMGYYAAGSGASL